MMDGPLLSFRLDQTSCTVPDVMQDDRIPFDGKEDAVRPRFLAVNHLSKGKAELL
jgi:hypothetical protein